MTETTNLAAAANIALVAAASAPLSIGLRYRRISLVGC